MERSINIKLITLTALFTALIAVLSQISVPLPSGVPVTLQTFAVALCGYTLGKKYAVFSVISYLILGLTGVPVFANFTAGPAVFAGYAGGFLYGFIIMAFLCGIGAGIKNKWIALLIGISGLLLCHLCGIIWFCIITGTPFFSAALTVSVPFMIKDVISVAAAWIAGSKLNKLISEKINYRLS